MIYSNLSQLVGRTPLLCPENYSKKKALCARLVCKLEYLNPTGSTKDRAALSMIENAKARGILSDGAVIIEPTSGNTGIGLAAIASSLGYRVILTMPETMSVERRRLLSAYGAEIVLTDGALGMQGALDKAQEISDSIEGSFIPSQFDNPANPAAHENTTALELLEDTDSKIDILVAGVGTGGTLTGTARGLRKTIPALQVVAVEPASSPLISEGRSGAHGIQGIGANFIPKNLDLSEVNSVMAVTEEQAYSAARELARLEGILCGISSGAALFAATALASLEENRDKTIAVILPDSADRYLSTPLFE